MTLRKDVILFCCALMALVPLAGCAGREDKPAPARAEAPPPAGVAFRIIDPASTSDGVRLGAYDAQGKVLDQGLSDSRGTVTLKTRGVAELRLGRSGQMEQRLRLPQELAEQGGVLEYVRLGAGREFRLELPVTGGTGYVWQVAPGGDAALKHTETAAVHANRPGGPAVQRLTLAARIPEGQVLMVYTRPWEKDKLPESWHLVLFGPK